jgi:hypothetical protein
VARRIVTGRGPVTRQVPEPFIGIAKDEPAFTGREQRIRWAATWCARCVNEPSCRLLTAAMLDMTPLAWTGERPDYRCEEYRRASHRP